MKLKKIASLALAGIMAVSMLAGCGTQNGGSSDNGNTVVKPETTTIVDALNKGQGKNEVQISFTSDATMDAALAAAVKDLAEDATSAGGTTATLAKNLQTRLNAYTPINTTAKFYDDSNYFAFKKSNVPGGSVVNGYDMSASSSEVADVTLTKAFVVKSATAWTEENAVREVVSEIAKDDMLTKLVANDVADNNTVNTVPLNVKANGGKAVNKYHTYDYTGNVSMVSKDYADGTTCYFVVVTVTQSVTEVEYKG